MATNSVHLMSPNHNNLRTDIDPDDGSGNGWNPTEIVVCKLTLDATNPQPPFENYNIKYDTANSYIHPNNVNVLALAQQIVNKNDTNTGMPITTDGQLMLTIDSQCFVIFYLEQTSTLTWQFQVSHTALDIGTAINDRYTKLNHLQINGLPVLGQNGNGNGCQAVYFEATPKGISDFYDPFTLYVSFWENNQWVNHPFDPDIKDKGHHTFFRPSISHRAAKRKTNI
jgi:hypothetical protein